MCVWGDQGPGSITAEKMLLSERGEAEEWSRLLRLCEIHGVSRSFDKTFHQLPPDDISALISFALSLRNVSSMPLCRESPQEVVEERIVFSRVACHLQASSSKRVHGLPLQTLQ